MFSQLHMLPLVRQESVIHLQLESGTLWDDGVEGGAEIHKQDSGIGS